MTTLTIRNIEPAVKEKLGETPIALVEKGKYPGAHLVSGAVVNPVAFRKLFPGPCDFVGRDEFQRRNAQLPRGAGRLGCRR